MYDSYFPGLSLNGPRETPEGSRVCIQASYGLHRSTVYPLGTYLRRPTHVYLLHGCSLQFALRPLDFRRGAFDAQQLFSYFFFFFSFFLCAPEPVSDSTTKEGGHRDIAHARFVRTSRNGKEHVSLTFIFQGVSIFFSRNVSAFSR